MQQPKVEPSWRIWRIFVDRNPSPGISVDFLFIMGQESLDKTDGEDLKSVQRGR